LEKSLTSTSGPKKQHIAENLPPIADGFFHPPQLTQLARSTLGTFGEIRGTWNRRIPESKFAISS
jgi:hypothetical protein